MLADFRDKPTSRHTYGKPIKDKASNAVGFSPVPNSSTMSFNKLRNAIAGILLKQWTFQRLNTPHAVHWDLKEDTICLSINHARPNTLKEFMFLGGNSYNCRNWRKCPLFSQNIRCRHLSLHHYVLNAAYTVSMDYDVNYHCFGIGR